MVDARARGTFAYFTVIGKLHSIDQVMLGATEFWGGCVVESDSQVRCAWNMNWPITYGEVIIVKSTAVEREKACNRNWHHPS